MAYSVPLYSTMQNEGVDVNTAYDASTTANLDAPAGPLAVGQVVQGTKDGEWVLCKSAGSISKYDAVTLSSLFTATQMPALPAFGLTVGIAMATATTTGMYLWVMTNGMSPSVNSATAAANLQMYTGTAAGQIGVFSSAGFTRLNGITLTTAVATAGATGSGVQLINARTFTSV